VNKPKEIRSFIKNRKLVEERRGKIFRGAASIFLKKGYGGTSMQELAQYLHMSK
jgi:AcrR family transcriptional regulator